MSYNSLFTRGTSLTHCSFFSWVCGKESKAWALVCSRSDAVLVKLRARGGHGPWHASFSPQPACFASCFLVDDQRQHFRSLSQFEAISFMSMPHITPTSKPEACSGGYKVVTFLAPTFERKPQSPGRQGRQYS